MRKLLLVLSLFMCLFAQAKKENQFVVRTFVREASVREWTPVNDLHVSLTSASDTTSIPFRLLTGNDTTKINTSSNGELRLLVNGGRGRYLLTLTADGYEPLMKDFEVKFQNQNIISLGQLSMLKERETELNEVEVVGTAIKLVVKGDTLVYNANAFNLAEGSMLDALIKQLDGVELDADGNITVNGRTVSSLLINGKDFFKGDPMVALENLPAYTVNNVKVYDKAAEDDYLTQSSAKLSRREDEENLVMDVVLKKEYNIGYMASVEGGYGTDNRWLGKLFGLGFSDRWRISAFANANNLGDTQRAGGNGWRGSSASSGENTVETGGLDYMYDHKKLRMQGNVVYSHSDRQDRSETASTRYYNTGDLFRRSASSANNVSNQLRTNHELKQKWDAVYFGAELGLDWKWTRNSSLNREATFNSLPTETTRIEALDSVFARPFSKRYNDILLSRLSTNSLSNPGSLKASGEIEATIRTSEMRGRVNIEASGSYSRSWTDTRNIYLQNFGGANTGTQAPVNSDRFSRNKANSHSVNAHATYIRDWSTISDDTWQNRVNLRTRLAYSRSYSFNDYNLFTADDADQSILPSLTTPEAAIRDLADSYNSAHTGNNGDARINLSFNREPVAPSPTGINPAFGLSGSVTYNLRNEKLDHHVFSFADAEILRRTTHHFTGNLNFNFSSGNDIRYWNFSAGYSNSYADPSLNLFLRNRTNTNPLYVYENNAENLCASQTNSVRLNFSRYGRRLHNMLFGNLSWSKTNNSIGQWSRYDPNTGITTARPMNINGNWNANGSLRYNHPFGQREQLMVSGNVNASYNHSVDFQSTTSEPVRSLVRNTNLSGNLGVTYKFTNGSNISLNGGPSWQYATSARERFNTVNAMTYQASLSAVVEIPRDIQLRTSMNMQARRGYEEAAMNTTQWLWNAEVTKSILHGNLVFKLTAVDILGQIDPVSLSVNAQGRTETWRNTLPRYAMVSVLWRFNRSPKKGANGATAPRMPGERGNRGPRGDRPPRPEGGMRPARIM